jgi:curved DNA-binding protein CbpA
MSSTHLYETLGLTPNVSKEEIKEAYLRLVHEYHASVHHSPASERYFREICEAYITLSKEGAIVLYEQKLKPEPENGSSFWQKRYSPAFILGIAAIGVTGALLGYSMQPKSTIVREIIRETPPVAVTSQTEKKLESQPVVPNQQNSSNPSIQFAKLPEMPTQKAVAIHSLLPQGTSNKLPALPVIPKSVKIVRILPAPAPLIAESFMHQGPKIVPQKKLMALPLFGPRAISSVPPLPSNTLLPLARPIQRSVVLPPPPSFISSNALHTVPMPVEEHESDEKLLAKLNDYDRNKATPSKDEDARILSDLNSLSKDSKSP